MQHMCYVIPLWGPQGLLGRYLSFKCMFCHANVFIKLYYSCILYAYNGVQTFNVTYGK